MSIHILPLIICKHVSVYVNLQLLIILNSSHFLNKTTKQTVMKGSSGTVD